MSNKKNREESSLSVRSGKESGDSVAPRGLERRQKKKPLATDEYIEGILSGSRAVLSRAITLIESRRPEHRERAREIIEACLPHTGQSLRIGITGVPGSGKSTFIETLGTILIEEESRKLAVLAIDPSSTKSSGSILGDKTRMEKLAAHPNAFIRPSPTGGSLGGVARKTRETIYLCEAAGYNTIFIETVGVGQSETAIHSMVDFFLLLLIAGAGDELQGIKRGIIEMADAIAINKTDIADSSLVQQAVREYKNALHLYSEPESGWQPRVTTCSAVTNVGIREIWETIQEYIRHTHKNGYFETRRNRQAKHWMHESVEQQLMDDFFTHPEVKKKLPELEHAVEKGQKSPFAAAHELLELFRQR